MLGIGALQGMGQRELFEALFGERGVDSGTIALGGRPLTLASPADAVRAGISMVPEDRKTEALFLRLTGGANASIPIIDRFAAAGWIDRKAEAAAVDEVLNDLQVHPRALYKTVSSFSGGNQQKIAIAKWLLARSQVLLTFDPTRGVDIGTKHEIYVLIRALAKAGAAILYYTTEIPELVNICDRVLVMYRGRMVKELIGEEITEEAIMGYALGAEGPEEGAEAAPGAQPSLEAGSGPVSDVPLSRLPRLSWQQGLARNRRLLVAVTAFIGIFVCLDVISPGPISYFEINFLSSNTGPLAFAAMGQTVVFLIGGFDLSCGAVLSLVNVIMALHTTDSLWSQVLMCFAGLGIGASVGAINGFFIAYMRLQPVVVTLAVMFIILGLNLLLMPDPGGYIPYGLSMVFTGDLIPDGFPAALLVILLALGLWALIKRSRFGTALYAVGSNEDAAFANGINVARTKFLGYTLAGTFYGAGGVFLSAQTSSGDPLVGSGMLLLIFAATILGGTRIGGGEGGCLGTVFAAFTLMLISNVLIVLNWSPHVMPDYRGGDPAAGGDRRLHRPRHVARRILAGHRPQAIGAQAQEPALLPRRRAGQYRQARHELDPAGERRAIRAAALAMDHQELGCAPPDGSGVDAAGGGLHPRGRGDRRRECERPLPKLAADAWALPRRPRPRPRRGGTDRWARSLGAAHARVHRRRAGCALQRDGRAGLLGGAAGTGDRYRRRGSSTASAWCCSVCRPSSSRWPPTGSCRAQVCSSLAAFPPGARRRRWSGSSPSGSPGLRPPPGSSSASRAWLTSCCIALPSAGASSRSVTARAWRGSPACGSIGRCSASTC